MQPMMDYLKSRTNLIPKAGIVLGTGLGEAMDGLEIETVIPYEEIPGMPSSTVQGHAGRLLLGILCGCPVAVMQGRIHYYEGYSMEQLAQPVRMLCGLGTEILMVTNASGGINPAYTPGDIVVIGDHIKMDLDSPLRGKNPEAFGERFFDMTTAYSPRLRVLAHKVIKEAKISDFEGVYAYMGGPQFETPAEIRMLRILGADLVGMSTVPEVITARHCGMEVLGLSCVTNMAAGMDMGGLDHEVIARAEHIGVERMRSIIEGVVASL